MAGGRRGRGASTPLVAVVLGDPRLPYEYNPSGQFEAHDLQAVASLKKALARLKDYRFEFLDDHDRLARRLLALRPALVLNFCNTGFRNRTARQPHVAAMLEMLELPYAGAGPRAMVLCHDKAMALAAAGELGVPVPRQWLLRPDAPPEDLPSMEGPLLVKPNGGDGSTGVDAASIVHGREALAQRLRALAGVPEAEGGVLVQEYLPGAEYSVGLIGNPGSGFLALPPLEVDYDRLDPHSPRILTYAGKTDPSSGAWQNVELVRARLDQGSVDRLHRYCRMVFRRLGCVDYARFDFRCDEAGTPRLIDVNAHPMWGAGGMLATMAGFAGLDYPAMLEAIITAARRRLAGAPADRAAS